MRDTNVFTDREILQALVRDSRLSAKERIAFEGMLRTTAGGRRLSEIQRGWAQDVFTKYELEKNIVSNPGSDVPQEVKSSYENLSRPMKPPGRK